MIVFLNRADALQLKAIADELRGIRTELSGIRLANERIAEALAQAPVRIPSGVVWHVSTPTQEA